VTRTLLLARTFFTRFFESDLLPPGLPQAQLFIWSVAIVVAPSVLLPFRFANAYSMMQDQPEALARAMLMHRLVFITLSMTAMGFVALVLWENVRFPRSSTRRSSACMAARAIRCAPSSRTSSRRRAPECSSSSC
jgi:hypothetical protein